MVTMATGIHQTVTLIPNRNHKSLKTVSGPSRPHAFDRRGRSPDSPPSSITTRWEREPGL